MLDRPDFRVVHFSLLGNHAHLIVEADDHDALARGMRALSGSMAMRLNGLMGTRGRLFTDRHHAHVLRTPAEVRHGIAYVLGNVASHARRRGLFAAIAPVVAAFYAIATLCLRLLGIPVRKPVAEPDRRE